MSWLADTNVLSELARPLPDPGVVRWAERVPRLALSAITVEEIVFGLAKRPRPAVLAWFERFLADHADVLPVSEPVARHAGALRAQLAAAGRPRTQADMLIAATAAVHGLVVVTRNERDFAGCGVAVLNPWSG